MAGYIYTENSLLINCPSACSVQGLENGAIRQQVADIIGVGVKTVYRYFTASVIWLLPIIHKRFIVYDELTKLRRFIMHSKRWSSCLHR
ncbi:TPA: helix-turn-helix domain-containing protein [Klebsiella pneumoniae subsp. pneumoniae]|nr:helix-turn-helix domain-containing protein [Klebsiella pneumoniae subsp. pneumoniae]